MLPSRNAKRKKRQSFAVTIDGVTVGKMKYEKNRLGKVHVWGVPAGDDAIETQYYEIGGGNTASRAAQSGALHRAAIGASWGLLKRKLGPVGYEVRADYGEQTVQLASRLPIRRAEAIAEMTHTLMRELYTDDSEYEHRRQ